MLTVNELVSMIPGTHRKNGGKNSFQCCCPAHRDKEASLTVSEGDKGKPVLFCHAGCKTEDILGAIGLTLADINDDKPVQTWQSRLEWYMQEKAPNKKKRGYGPGVKITDIYDYTDEKGRYLYSKLRIQGGSIEGKQIRYANIDYAADKASLAKARNLPHVLYRLPEVLKAIAEGWPVYIVEGEKDVETLRKLKDKKRTVTTAGSASDWKPDFAKYFTGANVILLPDNDEPGQKNANDIERDLREYAHSVRRLTVSQLEHGDVTDYLEMEGGSGEALESRLENTPVKYAPWVSVQKSGIKINCDRLAASFARNVPYLIVRRPDDEKDDFYIYSGGVYRKTNKNGVKAVIRKYIPVGLASDTMLNNIYGLIVASGRNMCRYTDLDRNEKYINLRNGLYNLETGQLEPHRPDIYSTIQLAANFRTFSKKDKEAAAPEAWRAECEAAKRSRPVFEKYITDLCRDVEGIPDFEKMAIIQEFFGLSLSNIPVFRVKKCLVLYSSLGNTGKTVLLNLISLLMGQDKIANIPITDMNEKNRFAMGGLIDKRLISVGDHSGANISDSSIFKQLTGGDPVKIEAKGKQGFFYTFRGGMAFACNGLPFFEDDRGGHIFERMQIIPCEHFVTAAERDPRMLDKMQREIDAIFIWFLEGLQRLRKNNFHFTSSKKSAAAVAEYREKSDTVFRYVSEQYEITGSLTDLISKSEFDEAYTKWCTEGDNEYKAVKKNNLKERMDAIGCPVVKGNIDGRRGIYCYRGLKKIEDPETVNEEGFKTLSEKEQFELPFK